MKRGQEESQSEGEEGEDNQQEGDGEGVARRWRRRRCWYGGGGGDGRIYISENMWDDGDGGETTAATGGCRDGSSGDAAGRRRIICWKA